ncbi:MAG: YARHG domain-containing protein [Lachnospiraceae bacterium]|nr:YARHG domain-containing protein [Lachnospiraceae bacterium]
MFCNNCGNEIDENSKFCSKCGQPVQNINQNPVSGNTSDGLPDTTYNKQPTNKNKNQKEQWTYLIIAGILLIAIIAGITIKQLKHGNKAVNTENAQNNTYDNNTNNNTSSNIKEDKPDNGDIETIKNTGNKDNISNKDNANNKDNTNKKKNKSKKSNNKSVKSSSEYILPDSDRKYYKMKDLKGLTASKARLARNELFARHGRKFDDKELQKYFNSLSWYNGTIAPEAFHEEEFFNKYEIANRDLIIKYEEKKGYR